MRSSQPGPVPARDHAAAGRGTPPGAGGSALPHQRGPALAGRRAVPSTGAVPAGELDRVGGHGRPGRRAAGGRRPGRGTRGRVEHDVHPAAADPARPARRRAPAGRSAAGSARGAPRRRSQSRPGRAPAPKQRAVQTSDEHLAEVGAEHDDVARAAAGRAAVGDQRRRAAGRRARGRRAAGSGGASGRAPGRRLGRARRRRRRPRRAGRRRPGAARRRGRSAGSTGGGPNARARRTPTSSRSGRPRPGRAGGEHPRRRAPADGGRRWLSRRSSSSCWAPGSTPAAGGGRGAGPVAPGRGAAGRAGGRPSPRRGVRPGCPRCRRSRLAQPLAPARGPGATSWRVGVGPAGGLLGHRGERVEGGAQLLPWRQTWSGSRQRSPSAGRTGRRSSRSPTTSTPLCSSHSIHRSPRSSAQS